jgi:hypothetical protein
MRRVYEQVEAEDRTPGQKLCRQLLRENPKGFLAQLAGLEKAPGSKDACGEANLAS